MGLLSKILGTGEKSAEANKRRVEEGREVAVETADGEFHVVPEDKVVIDRRRMTVWIDKRHIGRPPVRIHVPVEGMTAADNLNEKTEHDSRLPLDVERYSKIVNPSNSPEEDVPLDIPYYEVWY